MVTAIKSMIKVVSLRFVVSALLLGAGTAICPVLLAQSASVDDAQEALQQAFKVYNLESPELRPWHIIANYWTSIEGQEETGSYEEYWVNTKQFKRIYASPTFNQTDYGTEAGLLRDGDQQWALTALLQTRRDLVNPLPSAREVTNSTSNSTIKLVDGVEMRCVTLTSLSTDNSPALLPSNDTYCFDKNKPQLLFKCTYKNIYETTFADFTTFQGRMIAQRIQVSYKGKLFLKTHLEKVDILDPVNQANFIPPASAQRITALKPEAPIYKIAVSSGVAQANLISKEEPIYPAEAKAKHIEGVVVLAATINQEGHVAQVHPVSSPDDSLTTAATEAVRRWVYKPYLLNGKVVAVDTQINISFQLKQ